jgi:ketosteroid isomerase-like protein
MDRDLTGCSRAARSLTPIDVLCHSRRRGVETQAAAVASRAGEWGECIEMSDAEEIRKLIARYAQSVDDGKFDVLSSLFASDGEWVTPLGTMHGPQEIYDFMANSERDRSSDAKMKHLALNNIIDIDVDGESATAWSDFLLVRAGPNGGTIVRGGRYEDAFTKEDGQWRFARRVHHTSAWSSDMVMGLEAK